MPKYNNNISCGGRADVTPQTDEEYYWNNHWACLALANSSDWRIAWPRVNMQHVVGRRRAIGGRQVHIAFYFLPRTRRLRRGYTEWSRIRA